jgi:hypothetical protein
MNIHKHKPLYLLPIIIVASVLVASIVVLVNRSSLPTTSSRSGIKGTTIVDGGCPLMRDDSPCPNKPLVANITATDRNGKVAATTKSDAAGHFQLFLSPGAYTVSAANITGALLPTAQPAQVQVTPGTFADTTIQFDSGIR